MHVMNWRGELFTNRYVLAYGAAVLLHLLFFLLYGPLTQVLIVPPLSPAAKPERSPMVFEFVDVPGQEHSERPPEETPLVSDRQSIGRGAQESELPRSYLPYSEGVVKSKEDFQTRLGEERGGETPREASEEQAMAFQEAERPDDGILVLKGREFLTQQQREEAVYGRETVLKMNNRQSSAPEQGGFQLSTYAWDFAPYLSYLKRRVDSHGDAVLPPAFKDYGLIEGETVLRFKILQDGTLKDLEVVDYEGSDLLRDTSLLAVQQAAPFKPLPSHFPDPYLELNWTFGYSLIEKVE